jgi:hypothetical protein
MPARDGSPHHFQTDVRDVLIPGRWDMVIAHPPCTRLCNSGVRWLKDHWVRRKNGGDYFHDGAPNRAALCEAIAFFNLFKGCAPQVCIENPIPHGYAAAGIGPYTQIIEPWQFWHLDEPGAGEKKATCLWLENLPPLTPTTPHETGRHQACWRMPPTKDKALRAQERSLTYRGIADAMAAQWG